MLSFQGVCERQPVILSKVKTWAARERQTEKYKEFVAQLKEHLKRTKAKTKKLK
jgi:hypothetical protein